MRSLLVPLLLGGFFSSLFSQKDVPNKFLILDAISRLNKTPQKLLFSNNLDVNNENGHLQGIQWQEIKGQNYLFLSGSNIAYSYLAVGKFDNSPSIISIKKLYDAPLKHAGGFQISHPYLAVGIEDNDARNYSKVCIYKLSNRAKLSQNPISCIDRGGEFERSTAGCVGLTYFGNRWLVVVGDWNTRNLDFYVSNHKDPARGFQLINSIRIRDCDRSGWSDTTWLAYQNIQLINEMGQIHLIGMNSHAISKKNIADVFKLESDNIGRFTMIKVNQVILENHGGDFIWGSGVVVEQGRLQGILSCERNLKNINHMYYYPVLRE